MLRLGRPLLALGLVTFGLMRSAHAAPCVAVEGRLTPAWSTALGRIEDELAGRCGGAALTLVATAGRFTLEARSADGRRAERIVTRPRELGPMVAGLVASVPADADAANDTTDEAEESDAPDAPDPPPATPVRPEATTTTAIDRSAARDVRESPANLGATFGTRFGFPTGLLATELELRGDVRFARWVLSLSGTAAPAGAKVGPGKNEEWEYSEITVGILGGRWFRLGDGLLTLTAGPRLGVTALETETTSKSHRDLWAQAAVRYVAPIGDRWRPAVAIETEGAPLRLVANTASAHPFPAWSMSLRFGIVGFGP